MIGYCQWGPGIDLSPFVGILPCLATLFHYIFFYSIMVQPYSSSISNYIFFYSIMVQPYSSSISNYIFFYSIMVQPYSNSIIVAVYPTTYSSIVSWYNHIVAAHPTKSINDILEWWAD